VKLTRTVQSHNINANQIRQDANARRAAALASQQAATGTSGGGDDDEDDEDDDDAEPLPMPVRHKKDTKTRLTKKMAEDKVSGV
jgi:DNA repair protein RAD7